MLMQASRLLFAILTSNNARKATMENKEETKSASPDIPEVDNTMARELARAMHVTELTDDGDTEARRAAWDESKKDAIVKARKVLRRLAANGITLVKS